MGIRDGEHMRKSRIENFERGWIIGNFEPSLLKTEQFEVALLRESKNTAPAAHFQRVATEYNILVEGRMIICGEEVVAGDVFVIEPFEIAAPEILEDCLIVCVKTPSIPEDKILVEGR